MFKVILYSFFFGFVNMQLCFAQSASEGITEIDKAIAEKKYEQAEVILQSLINKYQEARKPDSLVHYIFYLGKVAHVKTGTEQAIKKLELFIEKIKTLSPGLATLRQIYIEAGEYYGFAGKNTMAYRANLMANKYTLLMPGQPHGLLALVQNNLSAYAQRMGNLSLSQMHSRSALKNLQEERKKNYEALYIAYNSMGTAMWYSSKTDSSLYYFNLALEALKKTPRTAVNKFYRPSIVENNLSALYGQVGKTTEAIGALKSSLNNLNSFIASKEPSTKKGIAVKSLFETMDNLAGIYKELGDLKQAKELLEFSYEQKQKQLSKNEPAIFISQILLGQLYYATKDFDKAKQYLNSGLELIGKADGDYLFYQADACNTLALLYDKKDNNKQAAYYYEKADSLYEESLQGEYDDIYLDFLRNAALFYADNGQPATAIAKANKGYDYVVKTQGAQTLIAFYQLLNLAEVSLVCGKFKEAIKYSRRGLDVVNNTIRTSSNLLDSIKVELKKPKAILLKSKAEYELLPKKDVANLTVLLKEVQEAFGLLERRKSVISDANDISLLMADHTDLIDFAKKITYDLYKLTDESTYISELMNLQESGIYNRIRARLDKNDSLQFLHIPLQVQATEKQLKMALTSALQGSEQHNKRTERYFKALDEWNKYQETIRLKYPKYYEMRYASIFKSLGDLQQVIPAATTLIRYFYIDKKLYAVVADNKQKKVFALEGNTIVERINALSLHSMDAGRTAENLQLLYRQLWLPLAKNIHYKKVVIIPDGILYNLNFEILTPQRITSFREIAAKSLLADYTISYHYSLILLAQKTTNPVIQDNFIAFAPGFSDKTKEKYRNSVKDSVKMDRAYLSLLPQPFTLALATNTQQLLGGNAFINEESTESAFKANAGHHKIIHIGTHAESNNDYPEFSRLLFAKNTFANQEDNSLYVDEIYNCDLASQLTVLTACESGKPGYEDGEGMISLTHAFNYAGSESIVTGLWKIDEQASALLLDIFYKNLEKGLPKDEALRQAKLTYLKTAEGRMLAPQYWAGLVIMGDVSPIVFEQNRVFSPVAIIGIFCLFVLAIFILVRKKVSK